MSETAFVAVLATLISGLAHAQTQYRPQALTSEERPFHVYALAGLGHSSGGANQFQIGGGANAANFGGGLNYWLSDGFGLRFDLRDHMNGNGSFVGLRGGVVLAF
jgi:opacity protein-like surface antigen